MHKTTKSRLSEKLYYNLYVLSTFNNYNNYELTT